MRHIQRECAAEEDYSKIWPNCSDGRANQMKRGRGIGCPPLCILGRPYMYILVGCHPLRYLASYTS